MDDTSVTWKLYIDPSLSLIITLFIISSTIPLLKEASLVLLQTVPKQFNIQDLKNQVKSKGTYLYNDDEFCRRY